MTDLTSAWSALPRSLRLGDRPALSPTGERDLTRTVARMLSWFWLQWRRREIIRALNQVDDRLLQDAGIERGEIEEIVDTLIARWR
jgi:uncharacterized protein YjiS (DUF1127 family)